MFQLNVLVLALILQFNILEILLITCVYLDALSIYMLIMLVIYVWYLRTVLLIILLMTILTNVYNYVLSHKKHLDNQHLTDVLNVKII